MLTEDYVSYETAKLLKEKGFDEIKCNTCYKWNGNFCNNRRSMSGIDNEICYQAPTLQMAMKWLREVHHLHISIEMGFDVDNHQYFFFVPSVCKFSSKTGEYQTPFGETEFDTYEEAVESVIKYCLEKLI